MRSRPPLRSRRAGLLLAALLAVAGVVLWNSAVVEGGSFGGAVATPGTVRPHFPPFPFPTWNPSFLPPQATAPPFAAPTPVPTTPAATPTPPAVPAPGGTGLATRLFLEIPNESVIANDVSIVAVLRTRTGAALSNQRLALYLDGVAVRSTRTDTRGTATLIAPGARLKEAGTHSIAVLFTGSHGYAGTRATAALKIIAAAIQIVAVPPLPGLRFGLGNAVATTGPDGIAALPIPQTGTYQLSVDLNSDNTPTAPFKASFVRWLDDVYTANRTIDVKGPATYTIGLRVAYRSTVQYVDLNGQPVDSSQIQEAQFSNGTGANDVVLNSQVKAQDVWWTAVTTIRVGQQLLATPITYRAISVKMHGADVVNRGQQAWTPVPNGTWTIQLLLYPLTVQTRDALFGGPIGGNLELVYPDGSTATTPVASNGLATFQSLPRGTYRLRLQSLVLTPPSTVALSKPQFATLRVVSFLDIGLGLGGIIGLLLLLAAIGRRTGVRHQNVRRVARTADPTT